MSLTGFWIQSEAIVVVAVYYFVTYYVVWGFCVFVNCLKEKVKKEHYYILDSVKVFDSYETKC